MPDKVAATDLVPMDLFRGEPFKIDIVYAAAAHTQNIFNTALYHKKSRLSLHRELARIVIAVARELHKQHNYVLVLKDGLRPVEAQARMGQTKIVQDNPHWLEEPNRLVSPPGAGAHPRGMAIDVSLEKQDGHTIDMGTMFDEMTDQSARDYRNFSDAILDNRRILEDSFVSQAQRLNLPMLPLPSEWWDFRFPRAYYEQWAPLSEADLPPPLRMIAPQQENHTDEWSRRFDKTAKEVLNSV